MAPSNKSSRRQLSFGWTFFWVLVAHALLLTLLFLLRFPEKKPAGNPVFMEMISLPAASAHAHGAQLLPAQPTPKPMPIPTPTPPVAVTPPPTPPTVVRPMVPVPPVVPTPPAVVTAQPSNAQSEVVLPPAKPVTKPKVPPSNPMAPASLPTPVVTSPPTKSPPKEKSPHKIEVNLTPAQRETTATTSSPSANTSTSSTSSAAKPSPTINSREIADKLAQELTNSGSTQSIGKVAVSSSGGSPGEFGAFYQLIREQMYQAWEPPPELIGFKPGTAIQIQVAPDGTILDAKIVGSSGNSKFDECALAAARKVGKLRQPRPEGCSEFITVNFRLT